MTTVRAGDRESPNRGCELIECEHWGERFGESECRNPSWCGDTNCDPEREPGGGFPRMASGWPCSFLDRKPRGSTPSEHPREPTAGSSEVSRRWPCSASCGSTIFFPFCCPTDYSPPTDFQVPLGQRLPFCLLALHA